MSISSKRSQNCSCRGTRTWKSTTSVLRTLVGDLIYDCVGNLVLATSNPFTMIYILYLTPQAPIVNENADERNCRVVSGCSRTVQLRSIYDGTTSTKLHTWNSLQRDGLMVVLRCILFLYVILPHLGIGGVLFSTDIKCIPALPFQVGVKMTLPMTNGFMILICCLWHTRPPEATVPRELLIFDHEIMFASCIHSWGLVVAG